MCGVAMVTASFGSSIVYLYLSIGIIGGTAQFEINVSSFAFVFNNSFHLESLVFKNI